MYSEGYSEKNPITVILLTSRFLSGQLLAPDCLLNWRHQMTCHETTSKAITDINQGCRQSTEHHEVRPTERVSKKMSTLRCYLWGSNNPGHSANVSQRGWEIEQRSDKGSLRGTLTVWMNRSKRNSQDIKSRECRLNYAILYSLWFRAGHGAQTMFVQVR